MRMRERDARWSQSYPAAVPSVFVDERNRDAAHAMKLQIGGTEVLLFYPGVAHTHGDLCVFVPKHNVLLTGDLVFLGYYPFIDTSPAGASLPGMATALRKLAQDFPGATFIPGHGPLARAQRRVRVERDQSSRRDLKMSNHDQALQHLLQYPLFEAILHRRSRRVSKGISAMLAGSLTYTSTQTPQPLTPLEEAVLIMATGVTGLTITDHPFNTEQAKDSV